MFSGKVGKLEVDGFAKLFIGLERARAHWKPKPFSRSKVDCSIDRDAPIFKSFGFCLSTSRPESSTRTRQP